MGNDSSLSIYLTAKNNASSVIKQAQADVARMAESSIDATDRTSARFSALRSVVSTSLLAVGAAAIAAGGMAVNMAGNFEQSLNVLQSVTSATSSQMAELSATARQLGQDASLPGISAVDAAGAMTELAKAGLSVNNVMAASKGVLSLAKAGQLDTAAAATITAQALNAFNLQGGEANRVADLLAAGANSSTASVESMAQGLQQAGASANSMGVNVQDTVTALALFSNAGIDGSDAGTSLKSMFRQLANPTKEASSLMTQLGLDFFDAQGNFVGLSSTAEQLQEKLGKLSVEQKNAALSEIFGSDASRVAGIMATAGAEGFDKLSESVNKQGAATDLAAAQNKGFNGALDNFKSTLETIGTDLGTKLLPPLTDFVNKLTEKLPGAIDWVTKHGVLLASSIGAIGTAFIAIRTAGAISDFQKTMKTSHAILSVFMGAKNVNGILSLGKAFGALNAFIAANPIIFIVAAIVAVIAALVFLQIKFNIFGKAWEFIKVVWGEAVKWFQGVWDGIAKVFDGVGKWFNDIFTSAWNGITDVFAGIGKWFSDIFTGIWNGIVGVFNTIVGFIQQWGLTILAIMFWPFSILVGLFFMFKDQILGFLTVIWNGIVAVFTSILNFYIMIYTTIWNALVAVFSAVVGFLATVFTNAYNAIVAVFTPIVAWFGGVFQAAWDIIALIFGVIGTWFQDRWNGIVAIFSVVGSFFGNVFQDAWNRITAIFGAVGGFFRGVWNTVVGTFTAVGTAVGNAMGGAIKGVVNGIIGFAENTINGFIGAINTAVDIINHIPGVHIPKLGTLNIPRLADGGIVQPRPGGVLANIAEGGKAEVVSPLDKLRAIVAEAVQNAGGNGAGIVVQAGASLFQIIYSGDPDKFTPAQAASMAKEIMRQLRAQGLKIDEMGALR